MFHTCDTQKILQVENKNQSNEHSISSYLKKHSLKQHYGLFLWIGFNCLKTAESLQGNRLLFIPIKNY